MCMYYSSARNIICMLPVIPLGNHSFSGAYHISHRLRAHVRCGSHFFLGNIKDIIKITLTCGSYRLDAVPKFYTLYPLSIPFIVLGFIGAVYSFLVSLYKRTFQADSIYLLFFLSGLITIGLSGSGYVYRANSFFICYLFFLIKAFPLLPFPVLLSHRLYAPFVRRLSLMVHLFLQLLFPGLYHDRRLPELSVFHLLPGVCG